MNGQTTTYSLDLIASLTQILSDGTNTYLYGLGRIAQTGTTTEYYLGDALGSVRQLVDEAGTLTLAKFYAPYGEVMYSAGAGQTDYGFTGETTDANGLVYLRARYYAPGEGRFLSRDTWEGSANRPLSLNKWMYVEGNPVNAVDPTGNSPASETSSQSITYSIYADAGILGFMFDCLPTTPEEDLQYDLTWWLALAMSRHGDDSRVKEIAGMVDYAQNTAFLSLTQRGGVLLAAYLKFYNLEGGHKEWDVKIKTLAELKEGIILCGVICDWFDYSTPGNIHFGFIAYRAKIHQGVAAVAGGALEQWDAIKKEHRIYPEYCSQNASILYCDNPQDQAAVDFGYMLAEKYSTTPTITEKMLKSELTAFWMSKFQRPPAGFIPPHPAYPDLRNDYSADHFNYY